MDASNLPDLPSEGPNALALQPHAGMAQRIITSMAAWDRIMLDDSTEAGSAHLFHPPEVSPPSISASKLLQRSLARAASLLGVVIQSGSQAPEAEGCVRQVLNEHAVAKGLRVELKHGAPPRHRLDDPARLLVAGQQGVLDEDGPCASPYVIWDGGMGRIFCHVEDLWLVTRPSNAPSSRDGG